MSQQELCEYVFIGEERRNLEYKAPMRWDNSLTREKITKSILAMSNVRDGGVVVIGVDEQPRGNFNPVGMSETDVSTFTQDDVASHVAEYADPYVEFSLRRIECQGKEYVLIQVKEFDEVPVICKRDGTDLQRGVIYTRTRRMNESAPVRSQSEMREIINMAVEKNIRRFYERLQRTGVTVGLPGPPTDTTLFDKQLEGLI